MRLQKDSRRRESRVLEKLPGKHFQRTTRRILSGLKFWKLPTLLVFLPSRPNSSLERATVVQKSSGDQCGGDGQKEEDRA